MSPPSGASEVRAVLFDFGGVLATEGFREGLAAIARRCGVDPTELHRLASDAVYESGYVTGRGAEEDFWDLLRRRAGVTGFVRELRGEILDRFQLRPPMFEAVDRLRRAGVTVGILSDQTDWLDELERRDRFFHRFDLVLNSYHVGRGKRDPKIFDLAVVRLGIRPETVLFVDDNAGNVERARGRGLRAIRFRDVAQALAEIQRVTGIAVVDSRPPS